MSFKDKVVLMTGASSGIGAATAILFSKEGANVSIVARNEIKLKNVSENCSKVGNKPLVIKADVTNDEDIKRFIDETIATFGKLDVLVNNAGIIRSGTILNGKIMEAYDEVMNVNLRAVIRITTLAAPYLIKSKGNIVNISSTLGVSLGDPYIVSYCTSKAGLNHFSRAAASELASSGVRVNIISPGPVDTEILGNAGMGANVRDLGIKSPLGRISDPGEIAELIAFVASDKAKSITGSNFISDNGMLLKSA